MGKLKKILNQPSLEIVVLLSLPAPITFTILTSVAHKDWILNSMEIGLIIVSISTTLVVLLAFIKIRFFVYLMLTVSFTFYAISTILIIAVLAQSLSMIFGYGNINSFLGLAIGVLLVMLLISVIWTLIKFLIKFKLRKYYSRS